MTRRKVAIIGYTPHRMYAPWADHTVEIWTLNDLYTQTEATQIVQDPTRHRHFQLHAWDEFHKPDPVRTDQAPMPFSIDADHVRHLGDFLARGVRVYVIEPRPELPGAIVFPREEMREWAKQHNMRWYFTNAISWQIALAIMEGFEEIGIYGVDMMQAGGKGSEYGFQRPSCEYYIAFAEARGIKVHVPDQSDLCKSAFDYGVTADSAFRRKLMYELTNTNAAIAHMEGQFKQIVNMTNTLVGKRDFIQHLLNSHMPGEDGPSLATAPIPNSHIQHQHVLTPACDQRIEVPVSVLQRAGIQIQRQPTQTGPVPVFTDGGGP